MSNKVNNPLLSDDDRLAAKKSIADKKIKPAFAPGQGKSNFDRDSEVSNVDNLNGPKKNPFGLDGGGGSGSNPFAPKPFGSPGGVGGGGNPFGSPSGGNPFGSPSGGNPFGSPGGVGGNTFGGPRGSFNQPGLGGNQPAQDVPLEEKIKQESWDAAKSVGKGAYGFFGELFNSIREMTTSEWANLGSVNLRVGLIGSIISFILFLVGLNTGLVYTIGFLLVLTTGFCQVIFLVDIEDSVVEEVEDFVNEDDDDDFNFDLDDDDVELDFLDDDLDDEESNDFFSSLKLDDVEDNPVDLFGSLDLSDVVEDNFDTSGVEKKLDEVGNLGIYTKSLLFDLYMDMLQNFNKDFDKDIDISDSDSIFIEYVAMIGKACEALNVDEEYYPTLKTVTRTALIDRLHITRPKSINEKRFKDEFEKLHSFVNYEHVPERFVEMVAVGSDWVITVYDDRATKVGVKDVLPKIKDKFVNNSTFPIAMGYGTSGETHFLDLKHTESMLVAGSPRMGKSWTVKSILSQLVAFNSPRDVAFFLGDVKGLTSDFASFRLPHVRRFAKDAESIINMLKYVVDVEAEKRKKLFASKDKNYINYWDYKRDYPDEDLPIIYIVLDEMIALKGGITNLANGKEMEKEYRTMLSTIVTQLPNLGIRFLGIPHVVKNEFVPKTVSDVIKFKASVGGDADHVEETTGFKLDRKLGSPGDMAVLATDLNPKTFYSKGLVLGGNTDDIDRLFDLQAKMWNKLEPEFSYGGDELGEGDPFK